MRWRRSFLVAGFAVLTGAYTIPVDAQAAGTPICGHLEGSQVWTAAGAPYRICAAGASVRPGLTIDASAGPVTVLAEGAGGLRVDGSFRTLGTTAGRGVTMRPSIGGTWAGLDVDDWTAQLTDVDHLTVIGAGARFVDSYQPMSLDAVAVQGSPGAGLTAVATEVVVRDARVTDAGGDGIVATSNGFGMDENGLVGTGTTVERAVVAGSAGSGLVLDGLTGRVADNVLVDNGRASGAPAATVRGIVRPTNAFATNRGAGNSVHAIAFDGARLDGGLTWRSPGPAAGGELAPLGYVVATSLKVKDGDLVLAPGTVLKMGPNPVPPGHYPNEGQPAVVVSEGRFVADGAVVTSLTDDTVGVPTCASALAGDCTPAASDAGGVAATAFTVTRSVFQYGRVALARSAWPNTYPVSLGSCTEPCPVGPSSVTDSVFVRSGTALDAGASEFEAHAAIEVRGNVIEDATRGMVVAVAGPAVVTGNVVTRARTGIVVAGPDLFGAREPGPASLVSGNEVRQAAEVGIRVDRSHQALVRDNVVRDSGLAMRVDQPFLPAIDMGAGPFDGNLGTGNAVDGILLNVIADGDWTWRTIVDQNGAPGPLGYAATSLLVRGTMTVPNLGVVRVQQLTLAGGTVDARAGDVTFGDFDGHPGLAPYASPLANPVITVGASEGPTAFLATDVHFNGEGELRTALGGDHTVVLDGVQGGVAAGGGGPARWSLDLAGTQVRLTDARVTGKVVAIRQTGAVPAEVRNVTVAEARMRLAGTVVADRVRVGGAGSGPNGPFAALTIIDGDVTVTCSAVDGNLEGVALHRGRLTVRDSDLGPIADGGASVLVGDDATADLRQNWWGQAGGPTPGQVTDLDGSGPPVGAADTSSALAAPSSCAPAPIGPGPGPGPGPDPTPEPLTTSRLQGLDRIATAVAVSNAATAERSLDVVVLARADGYADALAGTPLAASHDAPVLLTPSGSLDPRVLAEIRRVLRPGGAVFVLGGQAALAARVDDELRANGFRPVRFAGQDRFQTAVLIATFGLGTPQDTVLATGTNFPDSLGAGVVAAHQGSALLLTDGSRLPDATRDYLAAAHRLSTVTAVGGPAAAAYPQATTAIVGADRYATAVQLAEFAFGPTVPLVGVASGENFPDALAGGALMGRLGGPLLLSPARSTAPVVGGYLVSRSVEHVVHFGGPAALADVTPPSSG